MKPGTYVRLPDGRMGTVVYNGLDGVGIRWGTLALTAEQAETILASNPLFGSALTQEQLRLVPEAMLHEPYPGADLPCVGALSRSWRA